MPPKTEQPALPAPAHDSVDSMLSRKFGREVANYFSGSPLNRVGFLRGDNIFLSKALKHPSTQFLATNELQALISGPAQLAWLKFEDVKPVIGEDPYAQSEKEMIAAYDSSKTVPQMVFLGIDEKAKGETLSYTNKKNTYTGAPYFAVDLTPKGSLREACEALIESLKAKGLNFATGRPMDWSAPDGKQECCPYATLLSTDHISYSCHLR